MSQKILKVVKFLWGMKSEQLQLAPSVRAQPSVQPYFDSIGIVTGYDELRFQLKRITNAYIPKLHRYIYTPASAAVIRQYWNRNTEVPTAT